MTDQLTLQQINAIYNLPAEQRYDEFISRAVEWKEVWSLSSEQGWAIISDDGDEYLPVWHHTNLAAHWATGSYADCQPKLITLDDWLTKWLPGMDNDGILVAVCPDIEGEGIVVSAGELLNDIQLERGE